VYVESGVVEESIGVETREQINAALGDMWTVLVIYSLAEKVRVSVTWYWVLRTSHPER
jgi:hypothetical protein